MEPVHVAPSIAAKQGKTETSHTAIVSTYVGVISLGAVLDSKSRDRVRIAPPRSMLDDEPNSIHDIRFDASHLIDELSEYLPGQDQESKTKAVNVALEAFGLMLESEAIEAANPSGAIFCIALAIMKDNE